MKNKNLVKNKKYKIKDVKKWFPSSVYIFSMLKKIKDPEFPYYLFNLNVLSIEEFVIENFNFNQNIYITINIIPTFNLCTMASTISLTIKNILLQKSIEIIINKYFPINWNWNYCIYISSQLHDKGYLITKQLNDKERLSAAVENISIRKILKYSYYKK